MTKIFKKGDQMKFQIIKRNGNAVIPDAMFELCGMEDAKQISMVQLKSGILLMPESMSTYELVTLIDALNTQACEFLEVIAAECGPCEKEHRELSLEDVLSEFEVAVADWARESAGIGKNVKLECSPNEDSGAITLSPAPYRHNLMDVPYPILRYFLDFGYDLYALNELLVTESQEDSDAE